MRQFVYPEQKGNGGAGRVERARVARVREQQAKKEACMSKKDRSKTTNRAFSMQQLRDLDDRIEAYGGEEAAVRWWVTTRLVATKYPDKVAALNYARGAIRSLRRPNEPHNQVARDQLALLMRELGNPQIEEPVRVVAETVEVEAAPVSQVVPPLDGRTRVLDVEPVEPVRGSVAETGIVRVVDGIPFTLPALSKDGAEAARVTLTDLASALGYKSKDSLRQLADRNAKELNDFGEVCTVQVSVKRGPCSFKIDEPTYSPDQAAYLALSSETEQGRACRVRILKAYKSLLAMFEQVVSQPPAFDVSSIAGVIGAAVVGAMGPLLERLLGPKQPQNDPVVEPAPVSSVRPRQRRQTEDPRQHRLRFGVDKRDGLIQFLRNQASSSLSGRERSEAIRDAWHALYREMEAFGVRVLADTSAERLRRGEDLQYLDWIEENGHLDLAIECALRIFTTAA